MKGTEQELCLAEVLKRASEGVFLTREEVLLLLNLDKKKDIDCLFETARQLRERHFGEKIFLYGFIYFSTYCRNDCAFCFYRKSNSESKRYRKSLPEIVAATEKLSDSGVHLLDLTMGEDPGYFSDSGFSELLETVKAVKKASQLPLMVSPGVIPRNMLREFREIGVEWYACYQETHNRNLYEKLRLEQSYDERLELKKYAREIGFLIEEGLLAGVGETNSDLYDSFLVMKEIGAAQVRVMSFIPQKGTPLEAVRAASRLREILSIAVMRLLFPDKLIPASLDVDGISGLAARLNAGANVVTSIIPPDLGLLGVSQSTLDIEEGGRAAVGILPVLEKAGLRPASLQNYADWIEQHKDSKP